MGGGVVASFSKITHTESLCTKFRPPPPAQSYNDVHNGTTSRSGCTIKLWNKIDLQSPILSHSLTPNNSFLGLRVWSLFTAGGGGGGIPKIARTKNVPPLQ